MYGALCTPAVAAKAIASPLAIAGCITVLAHVLTALPADLSTGAEESQRTAADAIDDEEAAEADDAHVLSTWAKVATSSWLPTLLLARMRLDSFVSTLKTEERASHDAPPMDMGLL